jgi:hypothetical protein
MCCIVFDLIAWLISVVAPDCCVVREASSWLVCDTWFVSCFHGSCKPGDMW